MFPDNAAADTNPAKPDGFWAASPPQDEGQAAAAELALPADTGIAAVIEAPVANPVTDAVAPGPADDVSSPSS